jgi:hypothetical protein
MIQVSKTVHTFLESCLELEDGLQRRGKGRGAIKKERLFSGKRAIKKELRSNAIL